MNHDAFYNNPSIVAAEGFGSLVVQNIFDWPEAQLEVRSVSQYWEQPPG